MLLQRQVSGNADLESVRDIKLRIISRETSLQRLAVFIPNLRELNLEGSCLGSLRYSTEHTTSEINKKLLQFSRYSHGLLVGWSGFYSRQGQEIFLYSTASRPALGPTQPPVQCPFPVGKAPGA
jgi:hypothetical protein